MDEASRQAADRLRGIGAHVPFEDAVEHIPFVKLGERAEGVPYTLWQLVEHVRLAQRDILDYSKDPEHESAPWPEGYWPDEDAPRNEDAWHASIRSFLDDREELIALLEDDPARMVSADHSIIREVLIAATHLSYHTGQIVLLCRVLGCYRPST